MGGYFSLGTYGYQGKVSGYLDSIC